MLEGLKKRIAVARGREPADLILANARVINTFNGEIERASVAIAGGRIAGIGEYSQARENMDLGGRYVAPGFIDGHTHLESSMLDVGEYARAVIARGTLGVVTDLHEIANVGGLDGIRYVLRAARRLPFDLFLMAPSCVPATGLETSGAVLGTDEIRQVLRWRGCIGLGEMMNFPGVLFGDTGVLSKIALAGVVDGHAPGLGGKDLNAYIGAGIGSDHESVSLAEAREKLSRGMYVMVREGSSEKNLEALLPLVNDHTYHRCFFVVDDRSCADLLGDGDIDAIVRKAIRLGVDPVRAIQMATINTATYFRLDGLGAVAPGYFANLVVFSRLVEPQVEMVFYRGRLVAREGKPLFTAPRSRRALRDTVRIKPFDIEALRIPAFPGAVAVIEVVPGQIITRRRLEKPLIRDGFVVADPSRDLLKTLVAERHQATGNIGLGLVKGFGLSKGALASSVAHDSHNIVAVGAADEDLFAAVREVERVGGGLAVTESGRVRDSLPLPVAGLLSDQPAETVAAGLERLEGLARGLGCRLPAPFATMSFLALPVIPEIRLTDLGLVDVTQFRLVSLKGDEE